MGKTRVYYIDDKEAEAEDIKLLLEEIGDIQVEISPPNRDIGANMPQGLPDLFLIDYQLDAVQEGGSCANYTGGPLAAAIREEAPDYPLVLITKESILNPARKRELQGKLRVIDCIIYKDEVHKDRQRLSDELVVLASGYRSLRTAPCERRDWSCLQGLLQASPAESKLLRKAAPPLHPDGSESLWTTPEISNWIRNTIIEYPGILYDPVFAATELRISTDAFRLPQVQALFEESKYRGAFAPPEGRWWKERLWRIAMEYVEDSQFAATFAGTFHQRTGIELPPAVSIVRDESPADAICYIYHQPVLYKYTVAYRPDNRPPVMDPARVSFKAIQQSTEVQVALIEGVSDEMLKEIRGLEL